MKVDYIIPTYNSALLLDDCLTAIEKFGDPHDIIIIDKFSEDKTIEIAKKHNCKIIQTKASLGDCRLMGIENASTVWVAFIDSDVIINETWRNMFGYININSIGAIQADQDGVVKEPYTLKKLQRGFTGATLVRKDIIKDADINECQAFEDWFLTQHIIHKGYTWLVVPIRVEHHSSEGGGYYEKRMWHSAALKRYYKAKKIGLFTFVYLSMRYFLWYLKKGDFKSLYYFSLGLFKSEYFEMSRKPNDKVRRYSDNKYKK